MTALEDSTAAAKKSPDAARADVLQQLKAVVRVESVDTATQIITYKTADNRNVMRQVSDPRLLEGLQRGDTIEITYTRERAIEAVVRSMPSAEIMQRLEKLVALHPRLTRALSALTKP